MESERLTKMFFIVILVEEHLEIGIMIFSECLPLLISL